MNMNLQISVKKKHNPILKPDGKHSFIVFVMSIEDGSTVNDLTCKGHSDLNKSQISSFPCFCTVHLSEYFLFAATLRFAHTHRQTHSLF